MSTSVTALATYPVKGLRGIPLDHAEVERPGLHHDRRWAIIGPDARVLTQREHPALARIAAHPTPDGIRLSAAHGTIDATAQGPATTLNIWGTLVQTTAANPAASAWLSDALQTPCTLVHQVDPASRPVTPDLARPGDTVSLADGFPLLVTTNASLAALNARLGAPVPMDRFRPNLVLDTTEPWAEDTWSHIQVGPVRLRLASACTRCTVITLDQLTGATTPHKEPLRTLGLLHRDDQGHITFGWNAVPETLGTLRIGDPAVPTLRP